MFLRDETPTYILYTMALYITMLQTAAYMYMLQLKYKAPTTIQLKKWY